MKDFNLIVEIPDRLMKGAWHGHVIFSQWIIQVLKPSVFVELGVQNGDSYFSFCQSVKKNNLPTKCHAVDNWQGESQSGFYGEEVFLSVQKYNNDNYAPFSSLHRCIFDEAVELFQDGSIELLHIDGYHSYEAVKHDYETWLPKLYANAVVLFHDTTEKQEGFGVWRFWEELEAEYSETTFNFLQFHGLGVLGLGSGHPASLNRLFQANGSDVEAYRNFFSRLTAIMIEPVEKRRMALENQLVKIYFDTGNGFSEIEMENVELCKTHGKITFNIAKYKNIKQIRLNLGQHPLFLHISNLILTKSDDTVLIPSIIRGNYYELVQIPSNSGEKAPELLFLFTREYPHIFFNISDEVYNKFCFDYRIFGFNELVNYSLIEELNSTINDSKIQINSLQQEIYSQRKSLKESYQLNELFIQDFEDGKDKIAFWSDLNSKLESQTRLINHQKMEIEELKQQIFEWNNSLSWRFTLPIRLFSKIVFKILDPFKNLKQDFEYGLDLLKREGFRQFIYRMWWYLKGKRLVEDIYFAKYNFKFQHKTKHIKTKFTPFEFPFTMSPTVSIIIPVFNQWEYTYKCLLSIFKNTSDVDYEVIVADDLSTDETKNMANIVGNINIIRNSYNLQFLRNCNNAAKYARGKYIHFLNNDTIVHPNWLKSLVDLMENDSRTGIVGSKLLFPNGKLQEAGGIIWSDGSGSNYGKFDDPNRSEYNYVKESDYISGASLLIQTYLWKELEGFDELFSPAYYEDTDLAFRVRQLGYKVIYQPLSVITHFEGLSHGRKVSDGIKRYQEINLSKFVSKWNLELESKHERKSNNVFTARERSRSKEQILVIDHYVPNYDKDAGSRSTFSYLQLMVKMGYNVKFIGDNFSRNEPYTSTLQQLGIEVLYGSWHQKNIQKWLAKNGPYFNFVFLHRFNIAPKYIETLKKFSNARLIYVGHDLQFMSSKRNYELSGDMIHLYESERYKLIETAIFNNVDVILPFSTVEEQLIKEIVPNKIVISMPVYFYNSFLSSTKTFEKRKDLLFVGGFNHPPNIDAITWMVNDILPLIKKEIPEIKLYIVGSNPTKEVKGLASESVIITGYVSEKELEIYYKNCRVDVLPLRIGAGVKGKLLEAFYYQIPTVITPVAAEGVPGIDKLNSISSTAQEFASNTIRLYCNKTEWELTQKESGLLVSKYFTEEITRKKLKEILY